MVDNINNKALYHYALSIDSRPPHDFRESKAKCEIYVVRYWAQQQQKIQRYAEDKTYRESSDDGTYYTDSEEDEDDEEDEEDEEDEQDVISRQASFISHQAEVIRQQASFINFQSSVIISSLISQQSSLIKY